MNQPQYIRDVDKQEVSIRNLAFPPNGGPFVVRPRSRLRRWWMRQRGWTIWGDDCQVER